MCPLSARPSSVMTMTMRFERGPGSEETLLALYDAVVGAEELDLAEEAQDDAFWAEVRALYDWPSDEADAAADPSEVEEVDETERVTMPQAVGIVEHLLGGRPTDDGDRTAR
jgi:hypothetical protein